MSAQLSDIGNGISSSAPAIEAMLAQVTAGRDALPAGTPLGRYVVRQVIGRDDIAITYLAADPATAEQVEIDEYLPEAVARREDDGTVRPRSAALTAAFESGRRAFLEEAAHLERDLHPALLRVQASWQTGASAYRVLPLLGEQTLDTLRRSLGGTPSKDWLRALLQSLGGALAELHALSLVHGNVRPGNIAIRADGSPLLLGFDSARWGLADLATHPEPGFLAIEQTERYGALPAGSWTDVYALGAIASFVVTGRAPLAAVQRVGAAQLQPFAAAVAALQRRGPALDFEPAFVAAIDQALSVAPSQRLRSIDALMPALGEPIAMPGLPDRPEVPDVRSPEPAAAPPAPSAATDRSDAAPRVGAAAAPDVDIAGVAAAAAAPAALDDTWRAVRPGESVRAPPAKRRSSSRRWWLAMALPLAAIAALGWYWQQLHVADQVMAAFSRSTPPERVSAAALPPSAVAPLPASPAPIDRAAESSRSSVAPSVPLPTPIAAALPEPARPVEPPALTAAAPAVAARAATTAPVPATSTPAPATPVAAPAIAAPSPPVTARSPTVTAPAPAIARPAATAARPPAAAQPRVAAAQKPHPKPLDGRNAVAETRRLAAAPAVPAEPDNPRLVCSPRTNFALYRCMQVQCERDRFYSHVQCIRLRQRDEVF